MTARPKARLILENSAMRLLPFKPTRRLREWVKAKWILPRRKRKDSISLIAWAESLLGLPCRAEALGGVSNLTLRLRHEGGSHVVQKVYGTGHCSRIVALGEHLLRQGVPVPRILDHCPQEEFLLMEDLGPLTFSSALENGESPDDILPRVARELARFHHLGTRDLERTGLPLKPFSPDRWQYFVLKRLPWLRSFCPQISGKRLEELAQDLKGFRARIRPEEGIRVLCHMDWGLANLVRKDSVIHVLDWGTASLHPPALEAAKFLTLAARVIWDGREKILASYLEEAALPPEERERFDRQLHFFAIGYFLWKLPLFLYDGAGRRDFPLLAEVLRDLFRRDGMGAYPSLRAVMEDVHEFLAVNPGR
jgi:aminoglycoside/choline kinase family phosphotransferase